MVGLLKWFYILVPLSACSKRQKKNFPSAYHSIVNRESKKVILYLTSLQIKTIMISLFLAMNLKNAERSNKNEL